MNLCCLICVETSYHKYGITYSDGAICIFMEASCTTCQCEQDAVSYTTETCMKGPPCTTLVVIVVCNACRPSLGSCELVEYPAYTVGGYCSLVVAVHMVSHNSSAQNCALKTTLSIVVRFLVPTWTMHSESRRLHWKFVAIEWSVDRWTDGWHFTPII